MNSSGTHFMTRFALAAVMTILLVAGVSGSAWAATPYPMSSGPYFENFGDIANWTDNFAAGIGASRWASVPLNVAGTIPDGVKVTTPTSAFVVGTAGGVQRGSSGSNPPGTIVLLVTGTTNNTNAAALDVFFDFAAVKAGALDFDWASVDNSTGDRKSSLRVYWSTNGTTFTEIPAAAVLNFTNNSPTSGHVAVALPSGLDNSSTARLRFYISNGVGGTTGSRPKVAIDNLSVTASYYITASAGGGGSIAPSGNVLVPSGGEQTFTITPDDCHTIADVLVDGVSVGAVASHTITDVTANHTIAASFAAKTYTIAASAGGGGGISPSGSVTVNCGDDQTFTITANDCYAIADVVVDGSSVGAVASHTFSDVTTNHTIAASFVLKTFTIAASAGGGGGISPSGNVTVDCGGEQAFTITPDDCYVIADVLVDDISVGAVASHTFTNVTANHTIVASFALRTYTIVASAGPGGDISPNGSVTVNCGGEQTFTITADPGFATSQVLADGIPQGPVGSYTFTTVTEDHTISASFYDIRPPLIVGLEAIPGGTSAVITWTTDEPATARVDYGTSPGDLSSSESSVALETSHSLTLSGLSPGVTYYYRATSADGTGNAATYPAPPEPPLSFTTTVGDFVAAVPPTGATLCTAMPCVTVPVVFSRSDATPLMGYSVTLELSSNLSLCGAQLASAGYTKAPRQFYVTPLGGNQWIVDDVTLGVPCGATGSGALFTVDVTGNVPQGTGTITVVSVLARDCMNRPILANPGPPVTIPIDFAGPARTLDLTAVQTKSGNYVAPPAAPHERTAIQLLFTVPADAASVEVYRHEFGGYPQYDENGGSVPAAPASFPAVGWVLTGVTASGQTDEPPVRDYWYYALVTKDACLNPSVVSNMTTGTLDYHLGDIRDGTTDCAGDDQVAADDVELLHAHYGVALPVNDFLECLDVGATLDMSTNLRPTTDNVIEFEDLMMFSLNYGGVFGPGPPLGTEGAASGVDKITMGIPSTVAAGEVFDVYMLLEPSGLLQGLSVELGWDPAKVELLSTTPGGLFGVQSGVDWSPWPAAVDGALRGVGTQGLTVNGVFGVVQFRALAAGGPSVNVKRWRARDRFNAPLPLDFGVIGADTQPPLRTGLAAAKPTPFAGSTTLEYSLAAGGEAELAVFGVDGRRIRVLQGGAQEAGLYRYTWDGADDRGRAVPAGVYFVRLVAGGERFTRTLVRLGH